jgi:hypothetical protein
MNAPGPGRKPFNVRCGKCDHLWPAAWLPMEVSLFAKATSNLHCPSCGNGPKGIYVAPSPNIVKGENGA